jgi:ribosomal protein S18 acetylase RimI-like enzyme
MPRPGRDRPPVAIRHATRMSASRAGAGAATSADLPLRVMPWRRSSTTALVMRSRTSPLPTVDEIELACAAAAADGFTEVITSAIGPIEHDAYLEAGFVVRVQLALLRFDLDRRAAKRVPVAAGSPLPVDVADGTDDWPSIVAVDRLAFDDFWHLDRDGIETSLRATEHGRLAVIRQRAAEVETPDDAPEGTDDVLAYSVIGASGTTAYLQRLAVHPDHQGRGHGQALVRDGLAWAGRQGARAVMVNTPWHNESAIGLYTRCGFVRQDVGLAVLGASLR